MRRVLPQVVRLLVGSLTKYYARGNQLISELERT